MQLVSAEDIQQMFDEAFAQGKQAGLEEAQATAVSAATVAEQERQAIEDEAYQKGYDEGHAKADAVVRDELQAEVQLVVEDLRDLTQKMAEAAHDTNNFYAPLLKLATHLAEQLVRGELTLSGQAIARLVQTSLEEFDKDPSAPVLVRLNPEDLARIEGHGLSLPGSMTFKPDPTLTSGSVKVQMNGALIEDLIEDRAAALWHSLTAQVDAGAPPPSFLQNVALVKEAFDEVDSVIETADPDDYEDAATEPAVESRGV
jgi:flagellar biosynthesis/type III secretory pathway protein FliH